MFSLVYEGIYIGSGSSSSESTMLHHHVPMVAQNGQTKTQVLERAFCILLLLAKAYILLLHSSSVSIIV